MQAERPRSDLAAGRSGLGRAPLRRALTALILLMLSTAGWSDTVIPLRDQGLATFYLSVDVGNGVVDDYLVDTGAGFMTITEATLARLRQGGQARFLRNIEGRLADGRLLRVPVYLLEQITVGGTCVLTDVEAAVLPGASRGLFGLSALRRTAPFEFSVDPPSLRLRNCLPAGLLTASADPTG